MASGGKRVVALAYSFERSRVKKRFLKQMIPLSRLLRRHGFDCELKGLPSADYPTFLVISKGVHTVMVGILRGECRFEDQDAIFCVRDDSEQTLAQAGHRKEVVLTNNLVGVLAILIKLDMLGNDEIPEDELDQVVEEGQIRCCCCQEQQPSTGNRFKQCSTCADKDKARKIPHFSGFYCSAECQRTDWSRHKKMHSFE